MVKLYWGSVNRPCYAAPTVTTYFFCLTRPPPSTLFPPHNLPPDTNNILVRPCPLSSHQLWLEDGRRVGNLSRQNSHFHRGPTKFSTRLSHTQFQTHVNSTPPVSPTPPPFLLFTFEYGPFRPPLAMGGYTLGMMKYISVLCWPSTWPVFLIAGLSSAGACTCTLSPYLECKVCAAPGATFLVFSPISI